MAPSWLKRHMVPEEILIPIARAMLKQSGRTVENWYAAELEDVRAQCGPEHAHVPLDDLRSQIGNIRRGGRLGSVGGHGPGERKPPSKEYQDYLQSAEWKSKAEACKAAWGYKCALCGLTDVPLHVHHNTYERVTIGDDGKLHGAELPTDLMPLCGEFHKVVDNHRCRSTNKKHNNKQEPLFP